MISVIIPAYNEEKYLKKTLEGIPNFVKEIVVIDDGSEDDTFSVAQQAAEKDKRIVLMQNKSNKGKGFSMRKGAEKATCKKLIF